MTWRAYWKNHHLGPPWWIILIRGKENPFFLRVFQHLGQLLNICIRPHVLIHSLIHAPIEAYTYMQCTAPKVCMYRLWIKMESLHGDKEKFDGLNSGKNVLTLIDAILVSIQLGYRMHRIHYCTTKLPTWPTASIGYTAFQFQLIKLARDNTGSEHD